MVGNSWEEIEGKVNFALDIFYVKDKYLIDNDIHERSMTHKLAIYLEELFNGYDVDCEYNKNTTESKKIYDVEHKIQEIKKDTEYEYKDSIAVFPDIIIHKRGNKLKNLLVIEVKKDNAIKNNKSNFQQQKKCWRRDSNPQALRQRILSPSCIPVPPLARALGNGYMIHYSRRKGE